MAQGLGATAIDIALEECRDYLMTQAPHFIEEATEAQRVGATCPGHRVAGTGHDPGVLTSFYISTMSWRCFPAASQSLEQNTERLGP